MIDARVAAERDRVAIVGGPKTGKTTLASEILRIRRDDPEARPHESVLRTDDALDDHPELGRFESAATTAASLLSTSGTLLVEGTATAVALRRWMDDNEGRPVDLVVWLRREKRPTTAGQRNMRKGVDSVVGRLIPRLEERGVTILTDDPDLTT